MALANFPASPVNGATYVVNGVTFQYRVTGGRGEFVAQAAGTGTGTGGGIVYSNDLPTTLVPGVTYFDPDSTELVFSYQDTDSTQYLAFPLLAGSGSLNFVGGSSGGGTTITLTNAGGVMDGAGLVQGLIVSNYPIRRIKAGPAANVTVTESGNSVIVETLTPINDGTTGIGLVNTKTTTTQPFKRLAAGTNVTLTDNGSHIVISSTGGSGPGALGDTLTRLQSITSPENNNVPVFTAAGATQFLTTASTRAMMGLNTVANTIPLFTGSTTATLTALTPFMVTLLGLTGVPTALAHLKITSGSNANGGWLRIGTGDTAGVQICWHQIVVNAATSAVGSSFTGTNSSWVFPQNFAGGSIPSVSGTIIDGIIATVMGGSSGVNNTTATFRQLAPAVTANAAAAVIAIGFY